jgi:hypothetical protein
MVQSFFRVREREQIIEVTTIHRIPRQVFGNETGFDLIRESRKLFEVARAQWIGGP